MVIKANFGQVTCGRLGTKSSKTLDIIGTPVNTAARLTTSGFTITSEIFERLESKNRDLFREDKASGVYILL
jgi:class 3 adenylate cyclase